MWLSVDPLAELYPNVSPYAYALLNPVKYIDPTGMEGEEADDIIIKGKDTKYRYTGKGQVQTKVDGKWMDYKGGLEDFVSGTIKDLDKISSTSKGRELVNDLINSETETTIIEIDKHPLKSFHDSDKNEIGFDRDISGLIDGVRTTSAITLGHELYHGWDHLISMTGLNFEDTRSNEASATHFENYLRVNFGEAIRKDYSGASIKAHSKDYYLNNYTLPFKKGTQFIMPEGKCRGCDNIAIPPKIGIKP